MLTIVLIFTAVILFTCGLFAVEAVAKKIDNEVNNRD